MASTTVEFAVQMTCESCVNAVKKSLANISGVQNVQVYLDEQRVVVQSTLPTLQVLKVLESTGKKVAVKGYAGGQAAVSILEAGKVGLQGVVRLIQPTPDICIIDGTIDGLEKGSYRAFVHECGDISQGCENVGNIFNPLATQNGRLYGDLGTINSDDNNRAVFRFEDKVIKVSDLIGRAFVVAKNSGSEEAKRVACGVIARSAGLFQNPKTICACDGTTIWDEAGKKSAL
ncbi:unnamed protein product [Diabrotica balteata]|uniref:superoxide dismutase n=1 Tax=Diabrotica balteata TaxID=107213 RepID=A0A9N9SPR2_DIABA|nr:unnamed protein product [Diabrotica balteata]